MGKDSFYPGFLKNSGAGFVCFYHTRRAEKLIGTYDQQRAERSLLLIMAIQIRRDGRGDFAAATEQVSRARLFTEEKEQRSGWPIFYGVKNRNERNSFRCGADDWN